mgnify:CR=1 FL=1
MYISGVSTPKDSNIIVEQFCYTSVSKSFVSKLIPELDL